MLKRITLVGVLTVTIASPAAAQESQGIGLVIATPATLGVSMTLSENVALRPDVNFARSTSSSGGSSSTATSWTLGLGVPFYLSNADNLRTYVSPRVSYTRSTFSGSSGASSSQPTTALSLSYGAEWTAMKRLHFFGEVGPQYASSSGSSVDNHITALRSALGLILY
jgi:hypothetical protein